jgi:hypothetical protein
VANLSPDVIKIDTENYEAEVIRGLTGTLVKRPPRSIIMETGSSPALEAAKMLLAYGYRVYVWDESGTLKLWPGSIEEANQRYKDMLFSKESLVAPD